MPLGLFMEIPKQLNTETDLDKDRIRESPKCYRISLALICVPLFVHRMGWGAVPIIQDMVGVLSYVFTVL